MGVALVLLQPVALFTRAQHFKCFIQSKLCFLLLSKSYLMECFTVWCFGKLIKCQNKHPKCYLRIFFFISANVRTATDLCKFTTYGLSGNPENSNQNKNVLKHVPSSNCSVSRLIQEVIKAFS